MSQTSEPVANELVLLFDLSLDAFCIAGFDGYLKLANPAFARMLGYTREELLARPFMDNVHPDDRESVGQSSPSSRTARTSSGSSVAKSAPTARCAGSSGIRGPRRRRASSTEWRETSRTGAEPVPS